MSAQVGGPTHIYMVVFDFYGILDIDSLWFSEEQAEQRARLCTKERGDDYEVKAYPIEDADRERGPDNADRLADALDALLHISHHPGLRGQIRARAAMVLAEYRKEAS